YLYPFINCTNCGPRFTIIQDIPYDRPKTTMSPFEMCEYCRSEYEDPLNRRFHAQPVACGECGPKVWLEAGKLGTGILGIGKLGTGILVDWETGNHSSNLPIYQSTNLPIHQSTNLPIYQYTNLPIYQPTNLPITHAQQLLASGHILAIKGLGGFHLACDAINSEAVAELRRRKLRVDKPFALMMPDIETVEQHCLVNAAERELLESRQRPIVLLYRRPESSIARAVAPGQNTLGVMLPYTPLHYLLFAEQPTADRRPLTANVLHASRSTLYALVMTSGNLSEEPIAYTNAEARERLASLADAFLMHNRDIHVRCDDSVVRVIDKLGNGKLVTSKLGNGKLVNLETGNQSTNLPIPNYQSNNLPVPNYQSNNPQLPIYQLRRSRGYAPDPIKLPFDAPSLLATGPELKNNFCLTKDRYAFISHHIGDLENYETLQSFEAGIEHFERLFRIQPEAIACDMHPNYLATRYAIERSQAANRPIYHIQHHHAHIAACMADNGLIGERPVIGLAFDGTGYGDDGAIWGGEFLLSDYRGYRRFAHLAYTPLPGGDRPSANPGAWHCRGCILRASSGRQTCHLWRTRRLTDRRRPTADRSTLNAPRSTFCVINSVPVLTRRRHPAWGGCSTRLRH
ncbi:MAG: Sua5/YciO/YrdC/YwlC family protein, partial [Chloroflexota bacterium]